MDGDTAQISLNTIEDNTVNAEGEDADIKYMVVMKGGLVMLLMNKKLSLFLMFNILSVIILTKSVSAGSKKVIASSMHCYSYSTSTFEEDIAFDIDYFDHPIDWDPNLEPKIANQKKIQRLIEAGVDILAQTVFYADSLPDPNDPNADTTIGLNKIDRMLEDSNIVDPNFMISPEIVGFKRAFSRRYGAKDFALFLEKIKNEYGEKYSNIFKYDNRIVIFLYKPFEDQIGIPGDPNVGPDNLQQVWDIMDSDPNIDVSRDDFYVVNETYYCNDQRICFPDSNYCDTNNFCDRNAWQSTYIEELLQVLDNIYFWRIFPKEEDACRNEILMSSINDIDPNIIPIAAIRPGYFRRNTGGTNPYNATELLRTIWEGRISQARFEPEWIVLSTWDDYSENTIFEPSKFNGGLYSSVLKTLSQSWKKEILDGPQIWISVPTVIMRGERLYAELIERNDPNSNKRFTFELRDAVNSQKRGRFVEKETPDYTIYGGNVRVFSLDINTSLPMYDKTKAVYPRIEIIDGARNKKVFGPPIRIMPHHSINPLYQSYQIDKFRWPKVESIVDYTYEDLDNGDRKINVSITIENRLDNPNFSCLEVRTINNRTIGEYKSISNNEQIDLAFYTRDHHDPLGLVYFIITYDNGDIFYSKPKIIDDAPCLGTIVLYDISNNDPYNTEGWLKIGSYYISKEEGLIGLWKLKNYSPEVFSFRDKSFKRVNDSGKYGHPLYLGYGPNDRTYKGTEDNYPDPNGEAGYYFDGKDDVMRFPEHILPAGSIKVGMRIKCEELRDCFLLYHRGGLLNLELLSDGNLRLTRGLTRGEDEDNNQAPITAETQKNLIRENMEYDILFLDDGDMLKIYLDGSIVEEENYTTPRTYRRYHDFWNDLILVGGSYTGGYFKGHISEIKVHSTINLRSINLYQGFNIIGHPAIQIPSRYSSYDFLDNLGKVNSYSIQGFFNNNPESAYWSLGSKYGTCFDIMAGMGYLVYMNKDLSFPIDGTIISQNFCINLNEGFNLITLPLPHLNYSSYDLLKVLGEDNNIGVSKYNSIKGKWENSYWFFRSPAGKYFQIRKGEGYALYNKNALVIQKTLGDRIKADPPSEAYINVEDYGANGGDEMDDANEITAAFNVARINGIEKIYFPAGKYLINSELFWNEAKSNLKIYGEDRTLTTIVATSAMDRMLEHNNWLCVEKICMNGNNLANYCIWSIIQLPTIRHSSFNNSLYHAINGNERLTGDGLIENVIIRDCGCGLRWIANETNTNSVEIKSLTTIGNTGYSTDAPWPNQIYMQ